MGTPKPGSWLGKNETTHESEKPKSAKKPHILKPHLTDKPFKNDPRLAALKGKLK